MKKRNVQYTNGLILSIKTEQKAMDIYIIHPSPQCSGTTTKVGAKRLRARGWGQQLQNSLDLTVGCTNGLHSPTAVVAYIKTCKDQPSQYSSINLDVERLTRPYC